MTDSHHFSHRRAFARRGHPQLGLLGLPLSLPTIIPNNLVPGLVSGVASPGKISSPSVPSTDPIPTASTKESTSTGSTSSHVASTTSTTSTHNTSTISTTSTSTSTSTRVVASTTSVASAPVRTDLVTETISSTTSTHPSATGTPAVSGGISSGAIVGGIGGAVAGVIVLIAVITFFLRRSRRKDDVITDFNPQAFRRSAMIINDVPTHEDAIAPGFNPRPPTMIERRLAGSPALSFGTQYGKPGPAYNHGNEIPVTYSENHAGFGSHFQSHAPSQVINKASLINSPFVYAPISPYKEQQFYDQDGLRGPTGVNFQGGAAYPVLTRQPSASSDGHVPPSLVLQNESPAADDYVDLNRSSVSPYQAAQYVEISRRLNTEVPQGLPLERDLPPLPAKSDSPFADPESAPSSSIAQLAIDHKNPDSRLRPDSGGSTLSAASNPLDFPAPPSPAYIVSSRYRIDSTPPTLPEIKVESRGSMVTIAADYRSSGGLRVTNQKFPTTPSPLASSFGIPMTPDAKETSFATNALVAHSSAPVSTKAPIPIENRTSAYDPEDAYGGI